MYRTFKKNAVKYQKDYLSHRKKAIAFTALADIVTVLLAAAFSPALCALTTQHTIAPVITGLFLTSFVFAPLVIKIAARHVAIVRKSEPMFLKAAWPHAFNIVIN